MSDTPQGPGWWQASDGKWYSPEQSPGAGASGDQGARRDGGTGLDAVFSYAWNKFVQNIGEWVLLWLILLVIAIGVGVLSFFLVGGGAAGGLVRFDIAGIAISVIGGLVQGILLVVIAKAAVQVVSGERIDIGRAFALTGNNIAAGATFGLLHGLVSSVGLLGVLLSILVFVLLGFLPVLSALDDKGISAIGESISLVTDNAGVAVPYWLIGWLITGCLCFIGAPVAMIGGAYLVRRFRGEAVAA